MSDVTPVNGVSPTTLNPATSRPRSTSTEGAPTVRTADQVEFSRVATYLSKLLNGPDVRKDLVERVQGEIDAGIYDSPEKVDALLDELLADID